jgi:hypothetical protein
MIFLYFSFSFFVFSFPPPEDEYPTGKGGKVDAYSALPRASHAFARKTRLSGLKNLCEPLNHKKEGFTCAITRLKRYLGLRRSLTARSEIHLAITRGS